MQISFNTTLYLNRFQFLASVKIESGRIVTCNQSDSVFGFSMEQLFYITDSHISRPIYDKMHLF